MNKINIRLFLVVFNTIILIIGSLESQNQHKAYLIKSIRSSNEDSVKVNSLNKLSILVHKNKLDSAIALNEQAEMIARKINYEYGLGICYQYAANFDRFKGQYVESNNHLKQSEDVWMKLLNNNDYPIKQLEINLAGVYQIMADNMIVLGEAPKSQALFNKAVKYYEKYNIENEKVVKLYSAICSDFIERGDVNPAIEYANKAMKLAKKLNSNEMIASVYVNLANIYYTNGDYAKALENYFKGLSYSEKNKDKYAIGLIQSNIGNIYYSNQDYKRARDYYEKSLVIALETENKGEIARNYSNIGNILYSLENDSEAEKYYDKALALYQETGNEMGVANVSVYLANIYYFSMDYKKSEEFYLKALNAELKQNNILSVSILYGNLGMLMEKMGKYNEAENYYYKSLKIAKEYKYPERIKFNYNALSAMYDSIGNYKEAYKYYKWFISIRDSLKSEENFKEITQLEYQYKYQKKQFADSVKTSAQLKQKELLHNQKIKEQKIFSIAGFTGFILMLIVAIISYRAFKEKKRSSQIIEQQKLEVEEKNQEILDSIAYAKRIQTAILPPKRLVKEYLPESFILYKPKDIVAGDFYWMEHVNDLILFAAADCTGHGVPGAMVSVICNNGLNRSVREYGLSDPGQILDKTREIVIQEFEKSDEEVKDGMDISLCVLNTKTKELKWAGANNPIWIINPNRRNWPDGVLTFGEESSGMEIKADKQPIGKYANETSFTTHNIKLETGDSIYIFTDGYQDQFGGDKGKKFKASKMKELLLSIQSKPMEEQREFINSKFEEWKGVLEQIDDVCVIGVKIS
ncbi:MAG: tetratricopeptide repeat protein [Bacteroidia bacterium]